MSVFSCPLCLRQTICHLTGEPPAAVLLPSLLTSNLLGSSRSPSSRSHKRQHATYESLVTGHHRRAMRLALANKKSLSPNARRKGAGSLTKGEMKDALARHNNRNLLLSKSDGDSGNGGTSLTVHDDRRRHVQLKREVEQYYSDPLQLANVVTSKLRVPDFGAAIALVRASEGIVANNVVSWNHCVDWCMSQGDTEKAWKLYNEMKKRGHRPDSYTYTIMLRGLSQHSRKTGSAERAVAIYNSMFAPNSAVVPNTIHTNAVLNVCARAQDMESMWAIAGRLPERGPGAPDRWTFTTILNAIRENATAQAAELLKGPPRRATGQAGEGSFGTEERQKVIFDEAMADARRLWSDILFRWRQADLMVDERLVCAMGRVILGCGLRKDFVEVLDLVDSTMNLKLAERGHKKGDIATLSPGEPTDDRTQDSRRDGEVVGRSDVTVPSAHQHAPVPLSERQVYATPGNNTLSLILEAATGLKEMKVGKAYWHVLTTPNGPYQIVPDADNIISYLRLLRISRASKDVLDILSREWPAEISQKLYRRATFVIAMSTCIRDKNNPQVFDTADKLLNLMQVKLEEARVGMYDEIQATENDPTLPYKERQAAAKARMSKVDEVTFGEEEGLSEIQRTKSGVESSLVDPKALRMYLDLAVLKTPGWNEGVEGKENSDEVFERDPKKNTTLRAMRRLGPDLISIGRLAKLKLLEAEISSRPLASKQKDDFSRNAQRRPHDRAGTRVAEKLEDMIDLLRTMVSANDKVLAIHERFLETGRPPLDKRLVDNCRNESRKLSGFLSRTKNQVAKMIRGDTKFVAWRNKAVEEENDDHEGDEADADHHHHHRDVVDSDNDGSRPDRRRLPPAAAATTTATAAVRSRSGNEGRDQQPKILRETQRVYEDADRSLGRLHQRSRRQKQERRTEVQRRMVSRLGLGAPDTDPGVVDHDLVIRSKEEVERRMRDRALRIDVTADRGGGAGVGAGVVVGGPGGSNV